MVKDSQIDPKEILEQKAKGGPTSAGSSNDGEGCNHKKQSAIRHESGNDR